MKKVLLGTTFAGIFLLLPGLHADGVQVSVEKGVDELKHALGWDTLNMTTIEKDSFGRVTLERNNDLVNRVKRETTWFADGKKESETVSVIGKTSGRTLYFSKKAWGDDGNILSVDIEDNAFKSRKKQIGGQIEKQQYENGRLIAENHKHYSATSDGWNDTFKESILYFDDGDMKQRVTENPVTGEKSREIWGEKSGVLGRVETTQNWDNAKSVWD